MVKNDAFMAYLVQQLGGLDTVRRSFIQAEITKLVQAGATFGQIAATAKQNSWSDVVMDLPVVPRQHNTPKAQTTPTTRRMARAKVRTSILLRLNKGVQLTAKEISQRLGVEHAVVLRQLERLVQDGKVKAKGKTRARVFFKS